MLFSSVSAHVLVCCVIVIYYFSILECKCKLNNVYIITIVAPMPSAKSEVNRTLSIFMNNNDLDMEELLERRKKNDSHLQYYHTGSPDF